MIALALLLAAQTPLFGAQTLVAQTQTATPTITVTASRRARPLRAVPAAITVIPRAEIERHPSLTSDVLLRTVPGAQTFRRSSSMTADPTAQGLNLRGVGPSGVSRALVLLDGVAANDPFGGSVYWRALPRLGLDRIEIVPGGGSALYGSAALGGVVELFEREITDDRFDLDVSYGTQSTLAAGARAAVYGEDVRASVEAEVSRADGHRVVAPELRGAIDGYTPSSHGTVLGRLEAGPLTARLAYFTEGQNGGTALTAATIELVRSSVRVDLGLSSLTLSGGLTSFDQTRSRITPARDAEVLSATQEVPSNEQGALWMMALPDTDTHRISFGVELRRVAGESREQIIGGVHRTSGGEQRFAGIFAQDLISLFDALEISVALRGDLVQDADGHRVSTPGTRTDFDDRLHAELSPRLGVRFAPNEVLALKASAYRSFRAPTVSELYRPFQVGTVRTAANAELVPEHLLGGELGAELALGGWTLRTTGFFASLDAPITNATLATPLPDGSTRQRQNLGRARVVGLEAGLEARLSAELSVILGYTLVDARVTEHPTLEGHVLPQDPAHRGTLVVAYRDPSLIFATVELKVLGAQYEDDLGTLELDPVALLSASLAFPLAAGFEIYAAAENLLNQNYLVGRAGIDTVGAPLFVRAGVRYGTE